MNVKDFIWELETLSLNEIYDHVCCFLKDDCVSQSIKDMMVKEVNEFLFVNYRKMVNLYESFYNLGIMYWDNQKLLDFIKKLIDWEEI